jgi:hypothetical protein
MPSVPVAEALKKGVQVRFRSVAAALLIATSTGAPVLAQASGATPQSPVSTSESAVPGLPASPKELLVSIRSALAKGELLDAAFYSTANLQRFFGAGYRFTAPSGEAGSKIIYFDDGGSQYLDEQGNLTPLGRKRPCLHSGTILFGAVGRDRKARASMSIMTAAPADSARSFGANLVQEVFGVPGAFAEGRPSGPPLHGFPYMEAPPSNEPGQRWLTYQAELNGHLQRVEFRTLGNATVAEIQLFEEQR